MSEAEQTECSLPDKIKSASLHSDGRLESIGSCSASQSVFRLYSEMKHVVAALPRGHSLPASATHSRNFPPSKGGSSQRQTGGDSGYLGG